MLTEPEPIKIDGIKLGDLCVLTMSGSEARWGPNDSAGRTDPKEKNDRRRDPDS
jgi:hypothetical protein